MATVTAGYSWVSGETVTPAKLNTTAAPTVVVADNEVTTSKILDGAVTNAKLASGIDASKLTTGTLPIARITDAAVTPAKLSQPLTLATAQNTTSGTSIDFTGIPSWVKRITVMLNGVSTSSTSPVIIQLGDSGGVETSGYVGATAISQFGTSGSGVLSGGFTTDGNATLSGSMVRYGSVVITNISSNTWVAQGCVGDTNFQRVGTVGGSKSLSGTLTQLRLTTVNETDTFDAGSVNIMYEG